LVILPIEKLPAAILHLKLRDIPGVGPKMAERLQRAGITDIAVLWKTDAVRLRHIWGGLAGAKMHGLLHGEDIVSAKQARSSISHQHVLAPDDRSIEGAAPIMRQLLVRAAQRLRGASHGRLVHQPHTRRFIERVNGTCTVTINTRRPQSRVWRACAPTA
jgi:DNA polymerase-4